MNFADTNWLASTYIEPRDDDEEAIRRRAIVERFMRRHGGQLVVSHIVLLEARNVFSRVTSQDRPPEWEILQADFDGRIFVDPMNWDILRRECNDLFSKYARKVAVGTFDTAIVASAKLAGATRFLSFDTTARALATAEGVDIFPAILPAERQLLSRLKR